MMSTSDLAVLKAVRVSRPPDAAFRLFTERFDDWWPVKTHSVGEEKVETVVFEPHLDGRIYERHVDGTEYEWGRVTKWQPPHRVAFTWYPGRGPETGQVVELRFSPEGAGTRLELEHRGWESLGGRADEVRASYASDSGWASVLGEFAAAGERST